MAKKKSDSIGKAEAEQQLQFVRESMQCETREERVRPLSEGLVLFGWRFITVLDYMKKEAVDQPIFGELGDQALDLLIQWLTGEQLTNRADDHERRALVAYDLLARSEGKVGLKRIAAVAILELPPDHPLRDLPLANQALQDFLAEALVDDDVEGQLNALGTLLKYELEPREQLEGRISEGMALLPQAEKPEDCRSFLIEVVGYRSIQAIEARDENRTEEMQEAARAAEQAYALLPASNEITSTELGNLLLLGLVREIKGDDASAAQVLGEVRTAESASPERRRLAAYHEGRLRRNLGEYARALEILVPIIADYEADYLTAVDEEEAHQAGAEFTKLMLSCALAALRLGDWAGALQHVERSKSLRLRYRAALRQSKLASRFLHLENLLYAASRGVPLPDGTPVKRSADWLGGQVMAETRLKETYRELRAGLPPNSLEPPTIREIATALDPDEAAVLFGMESGITWLTVVCPGDVTEPSWKWFSEDWNGNRWISLLEGENQDGWGYAIAAPELAMDRPASLLRTLQDLDAAFGQPLVQWLSSRGNIRRLTLVPHRFLHLIPLWALPSLAQYECLMAPSAAHLVQARHSSPSPGKHALAIGNPTLDLPLSPAEMSSLRQHLTWLPMQMLERKNATQTAIQAAIRGCVLLHFCCHCVSESMRPTLSALLVSPELEKTRLPAMQAVTDPLEWAAQQVSEWKDVDEETRRGSLPGLGRLEETRSAGGTDWLRRFEYSPTGSLLGYYRGERLMRLAELWTAGDIMGENRLSGVRLAFLSACESGNGALDFEVDEYAGLPAALQLAGVSSVVATLWPVSDVLTVIYVELFYAALAEAAGPEGSQSVDVPALLKAVSTRLRELTREAAATLLGEIRARTTDPTARFRLEAYAARLRQGDEQPFRHPYQWAAFYASGARHVWLFHWPAKGQIRWLR